MVHLDIDPFPGHGGSRSRLLEDIQREFVRTQRFTGLAEPDPRVLAAIERVPRERFVPGALQHLAYDNKALAIDCGQTISQPYIVALMSSLLRTRPDDVVLEIGTGSGYQAAVLAGLVRHVYSIEIIPELAAETRLDLERMGYDNITVACRDGSDGWPEHAPFEGIIVTAATSNVPAAWTDQLATGGRMVIPIDRRLRTAPQTLVLIEKDHRGHIHETQILDVRFVPLTHRKLPGF